MARVRSITYTLDQSIPLRTITGQERHQYASIRPSAAVTIEFDDDELQLDEPDKHKVDERIKAAFDFAANQCFIQIDETLEEVKRIWHPSGPAKNK